MATVVTKPQTRVQPPAGMVDVTDKPAAPPAPADAPAAPVADARSAAETVVETTEAPAEETSASKRAKEAADRARRGAANNRKLLEEKSRIEQQAAYQAQQTQQLQAQLEQANGHIRNMVQDPLGAMKALGVTPEQVAQRMAKEGSPEAKIEVLEKMLDTQRQEFQRLVDQSRAKEEATRRAQVENEYKQAAQDPKKYPNLALIHPDFVLSRTRELIVELKAKGHDPRRFSDHDLLSYLDSVYTKAKSESQAPTQQDNAAAEKKTTTITNKLQTAKHVAPPDPSKMNDRQWKKWAAEELARTMGK